MHNLELRAGPRAIAHIREHGLRPADIDIVPGAAGGPKGLGLAKLDAWLFADWLPQGFAARQSPTQLIGASIGAWRFAAICRGHTPDGVRGALNQLATAYCHQHYPRGASTKDITRSASDLLSEMFQGREHDVLTNPNYQLNVLVVRGKGILRNEFPGRTHFGFAAAALANAFGRKQLRHFLERAWFCAQRSDDGQTQLSTGTSEQKPFKRRTHTGVSSMTSFFSALESDAFATEYTALTPQNFRNTLIASGSIPLVLEGVAGIQGAPAGTYWDGGIIDYHLHLPYAKTSGLVLYPHFTNKIVPGWLDKLLPWRKASGAWLDNVVLVSPTREYLERLPLKKLPDRGDFKRFTNDFDGRLKYWQFAIGESARLRDELAGLIECGEVAERLRAI